MLKMRPGHAYILHTITSFGRVEGKLPNAVVKGMLMRGLRFDNAENGG